MAGTTNGTSAWEGVASFSQLSDGQQIVYWLPISSTSTAVTLELTLSGGGTTGVDVVFGDALNGNLRGAGIDYEALEHVRIASLFPFIQFYSGIRQSMFCLAEIYRIQ